VLENYDKRSYKGLDNTEIKTSEVKPIQKGKKGIPLKYEDI
jgi:hypothetical protein